MDIEEIVKEFQEKLKVDLDDDYPLRLAEFVAEKVKPKTLFLYSEQNYMGKNKQYSDPVAVFSSVEKCQQYVEANNPSTPIQCIRVPFDPIN